jgi:hypothetical protein
LNSDPYNIRAEELAMDDCTLGVEVRRTWTEKEMVRAFDGRMFSGTPDGMFEDWNGSLTCVQVVRVPLISESSLNDMQETLVLTLLTKIVKSQQWLKASHFEPSDFIIFCWLPFSIPMEVADYAESVMEHIRELDPRFSLRLRVPADGNSLFPAMFATNHSVDAQRARSFSWSDVATYTGSEVESEEDDACAWDITWAWEDDWSAGVPDVSESDVSPTDGVSPTDSTAASVVADTDCDVEREVLWDQDSCSAVADDPVRHRQAVLLDREHCLLDVYARPDPEVKGSLPYDDMG